MDSLFSLTGFMVLSLFCIGGLYAYVREARRLHKLKSSGAVVTAKVLKKEKIDTGSESVVHYLVTYEYTDRQGKTITDQQDLNDSRFFSKLAIGDYIEVLYRHGNSGDSYPLGQVVADLRVSRIICVALVVFWVVTGSLILCLD